LLIVFLELDVDDEVVVVVVVVALPSLISSNLLGEIFLPSFFRLDVNDGVVVVVVVDDDDGGDDDDDVCSEGLFF